jgi:hypothetical protein
MVEFVIPHKAFCREGFSARIFTGKGSPQLGVNRREEGEIPVRRGRMRRKGYRGSIFILVLKLGFFYI